MLWQPSNTHVQSYSMKSQMNSNLTFVFIIDYYCFHYVDKLHVVYLSEANEEEKINDKEIRI